MATTNAPYIKLRILAHSLVDLSLPSESAKKVILLIGCKRERQRSSGEAGPCTPQLAPPSAEDRGTDAPSGSSPTASSFLFL